MCGISVGRLTHLAGLIRLRGTSRYASSEVPGSPAGTGGASMGGEVIDSVSGEQLAAVVKSGKGSQFTLNVFSTMNDLKSLIDTWAKEAETRLRELLESHTN